MELKVVRKTWETRCVRVEVVGHGATGQRDCRDIGVNYKLLGKGVRGKETQVPSENTGSFSETTGDIRVVSQEEMDPVPSSRVESRVR